MVGVGGGGREGRGSRVRTEEEEEEQKSQLARLFPVESWRNDFYGQCIVSDGNQYSITFLQLPSDFSLPIVYCLFTYGHVHRPQTGLYLSCSKNNNKNHALYTYSFVPVSVTRLG